jgi:hypothetical protein
MCPELKDLPEQIATAATTRRGSPGSALAEFEPDLSRQRRCSACVFRPAPHDPQTVADLTSEMIVRAAGSFGGDRAG